MGEEWRRGWHPEIIQPKTLDEPVLVIGGGPAGLECALQAFQARPPVNLAEAARSWAGACWARAGCRACKAISACATIASICCGRPRPSRSTSTASSARGRVGFGVPNVFVATGAHWRRNGVGRTHMAKAIPGLEAMPVFGPDDLMAGTVPSGRVVVFDDDLYYMGTALTELLRDHGAEVVFVTPGHMVAPFTQHTLEQERVQARMIERDVDIRCLRSVDAVAEGRVTVRCGLDRAHETVEADAIVLVTARDPQDQLYLDLKADAEALAAHGVKRLHLIGDAHAPAAVAHAV